MYLVSQWYPREYLATRIAAFYCFGVFAGSFSGLLAYAINYMDGVGGITTVRSPPVLLLGGGLTDEIVAMDVHPRRCVFHGAADMRICSPRIGIATCVIAFGVYLAVPDHPTTCKWLTEEERAICLKHLAKSGEHNSAHHFSLPVLKAALTDYKVLICIWLGESRLANTSSE